LWGPGTEHPSGFNQFLEGLKRLGTGAMELHAMHLKSTGALCARTLSYETCEFELVDGVSNPKIRSLYNRASEIWTDLHAQLADRCKKLNERDEMQRQIERLQGDMSDDEGENLGDGMRYHLDLHRDSDSESDDGEDGAKLAEERMLRRIYRKRQSKILKSELLLAVHVSYFVAKSSLQISCGPELKLMFLFVFTLKVFSGQRIKDFFEASALPPKLTRLLTWRRRLSTMAIAASSGFNLREKRAQEALRRPRATMLMMGAPLMNLRPLQMKI